MPTFVQQRGCIGFTSHLKTILREKSSPFLFYLNSVRNLSHSHNNSEATKEDVPLNQYAGMRRKRKMMLYGWGMCRTGALGDKWLLEDVKRHLQLTPLKLTAWNQDGKVEKVACGYGTSCVVTNKKGKQSLKVAGINTDCQLGSHNNLRSKTGVGELSILAANEKIVDVACGRAHSLVATDQARVYCLGNNRYGQCGRRIIEDEVHSGHPVVHAVNFDSPVKQVHCGQDHSVVVLQDGSVMTCGIGSDGQTGQGHYDNVGRFERVQGDLQGEHIVQVSCKADTVLAVSDKGDMFGWGNNEYDQLSNVSDEQQVNVARHLRSGVAKVAAAGSMCALVDVNEQVHTWGYGILGRGPAVDRCKLPEPLPSTLFQLPSSRGKRQQVKDLQCGLYHFALLTEAGHLYVWGSNKFSCLGLGHVNHQYFPYKVSIAAEVREVACGVDHCMALCQSFF